MFKWIVFLNELIKKLSELDSSDSFNNLIFLGLQFQATFNVLEIYFEIFVYFKLIFYHIASMKYCCVVSFPNESSDFGS
jgi:hypothetical protein